MTILILIAAMFFLLDLVSPAKTDKGELMYPNVKDDEYEGY